jgi:leucyl aminopeptidase (aminopeptidase T)
MDERLLDIVREGIRGIYRTNLGIRRSERVLVFTDSINEESISGEEQARRQDLLVIAKEASSIGKEFAREVTYILYPARRSHAVEPPENLWRAAFGGRAIDALVKEGDLLAPVLQKKAGQAQMKEVSAVIEKYARDAVDAIMALSNFSTTHTAFRKLFNTAAGGRYASMPLFDAGMFAGAMKADYPGMKRLTRAVARAVKTASALELKTPNGTRLYLERGKRTVKEDNGDYARPGSAGNLPAGEAYLAPIEGTARGVLVLDWAPTRKLSSPVTLRIKDGLVTEVSGTEFFALELRDKLSLAPENANIAELGIGTNSAARRPDNILESEKILGTVHVALGDNSTFGGKVKASFHQDFIFFKPTLTLIDGLNRKWVIIRDGSMQVPV